MYRFAIHLISIFTLMALVCSGFARRLGKAAMVPKGRPGTSLEGIIKHVRKDTAGRVRSKYVEAAQKAQTKCLAK